MRSLHGCKLFHVSIMSFPRSSRKACFLRSSGIGSFSCRVFPRSETEDEVNAFAWEVSAENCAWFRCGIVAWTGDESLDVLLCNRRPCAQDMIRERGSSRERQADRWKAFPLSPPWSRSPCLPFSRSPVIPLSPTPSPPSPFKSRNRRMFGFFLSPDCGGCGDSMTGRLEIRSYVIFSIFPFA